MTDREALYKAICEQPDEDTPRLAFADFLEEEGGKENAFRAEFIRTHIQLTREEPWSKTWRELNELWQEMHQKTEELAQEHKLPWVKHLSGRVRAWDFERGLVGHITVYSKRFVAEGNAYFEQDPIRSVKFVTLASKQGSVPAADLFACSHFARIAKLNFDGSQLTDKELDRLAIYPCLPRLQSLILDGENPFSKVAIPNLLKKLPTLNELSLNRNEDFDDAHAIALAKCPEFAQIATLNLSKTGTKDEGVAAIVSSPHAKGLAVLQLAPTTGEETIYYMSRATPQSRASGMAIAEAIAGSKSLGNLRELHLDYRVIGNEGLKLLMKSTALPALRCLSLSSNAITIAGVKALAKSPFGQQLLFLDLNYNSGLEKHIDAIVAMFPNAHVEALLNFDD